MIVLLNGTSSSGKTTLAKALQDVLPTPFLMVGIDTVVYALPRRYLDEPQHWAEVFEYEYSDGRIASVTPGDYGRRLVCALHSAVVAMAEEGLDIVVDHVLLDPAWANGLETKLHGLDLFRVGVRCPLEAVRQREASRRDRTLGQAEAQYHVVHRVMRYDVEVDTATRSPEECAGLIVAAMRFAERPTG